MSSKKPVPCFFFWLVIVTLLAGCGRSTDQAPPALSPSPTSTSTPSLSRTPAPTARPLVEDTTEEAGLYQNSTLGVSFAYPPDWALQVESSGGLEFVTVTNSLLPVSIMLEMMYIPEGEDFESIAEEAFFSLPFYLGLDEMESTYVNLDYELTNGTDAWQARGEVTLPETDSQIKIEVIAAQRSNLIFQLYTIVGLGGPPSLQPILDGVRESFLVFSPRPYGVDREQALFLAAGEPNTFDPAKWQYGADSVIGDLFSGLVKLTPDLQVIPDLAETWTVSPDGKVYTFYLRQGVTFHDGKPFTAADVKYSWERACDPATDSDTAETYLGDIVGVAEVVSGEAAEISGLKVIDDYTLEVTLDEAKAYFPYKLAYVTSWIVDSETIGDIEDAPNGTGPFKLVRYDPEELMILARNANYYRKFVELEYVVYLIYQGPSIRLYEAGDIDLVYVDEELVDRAEDPLDPLYGNVQTATELCTTYVIFDLTQPPFDEFAVREAFTKAIDKERYNNVVTEGKGVIAGGLYPPGLPGYHPDVQPIPYAPDQARAALASSSYGGPEGLPEIVLTTQGEGGDLFPSDAILLQMWEDVLGVKVVVEQINYENFLDEIYAGNHGQIIPLGWCADYPDPENFADFLFHSGADQNLAGYSNPDLDALLEEARSMTDVGERLALYQEIEQIIIDDMPVAFLAHSRPYYLITKPYVQGYYSSPIGAAQLMNVSLEREE